MDIVAHGAWAWLGADALARRHGLPRAAVAGAVVAATLPDLLHLLPVAGWALASGTPVALIRDYVMALPGQEPVLPAWVAELSHHLHCSGHSAVFAALATAAWAALARQRRGLGLVLAGWWCHLLIDIPTHSAAYYPVPVLYPFTQRGFDGLAWNTPLALALNYTALAVALAWRWRQRHHGGGNGGGNGG